MPDNKQNKLPLQHTETTNHVQLHNHVHKTTTPANRPLRQNLYHATSSTAPSETCKRQLASDTVRPYYDNHSQQVTQQNKRHKTGDKYDERNIPLRKRILLSFFDGLATAALIFQMLKIELLGILAWETDDDCQRLSSHNFPQTQQRRLHIRQHRQHTSVTRQTRPTTRSRTSCHSRTSLPRLQQDQRRGVSRSTRGRRV